MKTITIIFLLLLTVFSLKFNKGSQNHKAWLTNSQPQELKTGGYYTHPPRESDKPIDDFVHSKIPQLNDATLTSISTQVVNGYNHRLTYQKNGLTWTITVYEDQDGNYQMRGISKKSTKANKNGQQMLITQQTNVQSRDFNTIAKDMFKVK